MSAEGTRYPSLIQFHSIPTWLDERASEREREREGAIVSKKMRANAARMRRECGGIRSPSDSHFIQPARAALYLADDRIRRMQRNEIHRDGYGRHPAVDRMLRVHARAYAYGSIGAVSQWQVSSRESRHQQQRFRADYPPSVPLGFACARARARATSVAQTGE